MLPVAKNKNEMPHKINAALCTSTSDVLTAKCSCITGASVYCSHIIWLLYLADHAKKLNLSEFPQSGTCTDNPQQWHKPRTKGISAEPIMLRPVIKAVYSAKRTVGIRPTLYEAR